MRSNRVLRALATLSASLAVVVLLDVAPAQAGTAIPGVNVVFGVIADASGRRLPGAHVSLELAPSAGYDTPGGALIHELAQTVTDAVGAFILQLPTTADLLAEAEYLNGAVNMTLRAVKIAAEDGAWHTYVGTGGIYTQVVEYGPSPTGYATAPLNIGVMYVEDVKAQAGLSGFAETPSDDPEDPHSDHTAVVGVQANGLPDAGWYVGQTPWVSAPYVPVPDALGNSVTVNAPPTLPEYPAGTPENDDDRSGDDRCKSPSNQNTWIVDRIDLAYRNQPVGEVHSSLGEKIRYHYEEHAATTLGMAVSHEGGAWKVSGAAEMSNDGSTKTAIGWLNDTHAHRVLAEFVYVYNYLTWCPQGYDATKGPMAAHSAEIKALHWTGGLVADSNWIGGDTAENLHRAIKDGRAMKVRPGNECTKTTGKTYKYTAGVSAFGVGLNATSANDVHHTLELQAGTSREYWYAWGDKGAPADPKNHAIYSYYE
jgi:hypothetical protein